MQIVEHWNEPDDKGIILKPLGNASSGRLELYVSHESQNFDGVSLQFEVQDIQAFVKDLGDEIDHSGPILRPWGSLYVYLTDPNGIQVIVYSSVSKLYALMV